MVKTTIDGLAVRTSSTTRRTTGQPAHRRTNSSTTARSTSGVRSTASSSRPSATRLLDGGIQSVAASDDFLQPVRGFDFDDIQSTRSTTSSRRTADDADWSDLLDEMNSKQPASEEIERLDPLLEAWGDDEEEEPEEKPKRRARPHKKKRHILRTAAILLFLLLIGGGVVCYIWGDQIISKLTNGQSGLWDTFAAMVSEATPLETDRYGRTNVLIFGTEGFDMEGNSENGIHDGAELTDSLMVISLDQETKDVALISIPRDLKVGGGCMVGKINEVYSCNNEGGTNEEAGAQAIMKQVGAVLGMDFQYWAHVNWGSLLEIVDSLGGITVTLDEDIDDYYYTGMVVKAGVPVELDGYHAIALARARHGTTGGDFTRGNTQQKIVEGIVQKVLDSGVGATEAFNLLNILGDNLRTNFSSEYIKTGLHLANGFQVSQIRQIPLVDYENGIYYVDSATINDISYVLPKDEGGVNGTVRLQNYIREMLGSDPVAREQATIAVFNATGGYGVASAEQAKLREDGYTVPTVGNAAEDDCDQAYCVYVMNEEKTATAKALAERYGVTVRPAAALPTDVWPDGADFVVIVGSSTTTD